MAIRQFGLEAKAKMGIAFGAVALVATIISIVSDVLTYNVIGGLQNGGATVAEAQASDDRQMVVALVVAAAYIAAVTGYFFWVNAANNTLRALGVQGMKFSPGAAVGYYFIPFYNLVAGYQIMEEVWVNADTSRTTGQGSGLGKNLPGLVLLWWLLWVGGGLVSRISNSLLGRNPNLADIQVSTMVSILASLIALASCVVHIVLLRKATDMLMKRARIQFHASAAAAAPTSEGPPHG